MAVFLLLGVTTFVFGYLKITSAISSPSSRERNFHIKSQEELEQERTDALKLADTDGDGVNDYDEQYVFRTSPYLEDSDSDGFPDGKEIAEGYDPNCPRGKTCRATSATSNAPAPSAFVTGEFDQQAAAMHQAADASSSTSGLAQISQIADGAAEDEPAVDPSAVITETFGDVSKLTAEQFKAKVQSLSTDQIRSFLVKLGVPEATVRGASDSVLREVVGEALMEAMENYNSPAQ